jgi:hypothetical protein
MRGTELWKDYAYRGQEAINASVIQAILHAVAWQKAFVEKDRAILTVVWCLRQLCPTWVDVFHGRLWECLRGLPVDDWIMGEK